MDHTLVALIILAVCFILSLIYVGMSFSEIRGELKGLQTDLYSKVSFAETRYLRETMREQEERHYAAIDAVLAHLKLSIVTEKKLALPARWTAVVYKAKKGVR